MNKQSHGGAVPPSGSIGLKQTRDLGDLSVRKAPRLWMLQNFLFNRSRDLPRLGAMALLGRTLGVMRFESKLEGVVYRPDFSRLAPEQLLKLKELLALNVDVRMLPAFFGGQALDYGVLGTRVVTTVGVGFIVDAFQNLVEVENMKYHGFGTGTGAEASSDTGLGTEFTTEYATDNTRPTGTTTEGASANIYRTVATFSPDSGGTLAVTEHGIFSASSAGVLLDRTKFSAVNLVASADSLQATYELTFSAGG